MKALFLLSYYFLKKRALVSFLCLLSFSVSTILLLGTHRFQESIRMGFSGSISGVDLIAGAKGWPCFNCCFIPFFI